MAYFERPWLLAAALILPALLVGAVRYDQRRRRQRLARLGGESLIGRLSPVALSRPVGWRSLRLGLAGLLCGIALAGPRWGVERSVVRGEGIDLVLALDASLSMLATDERPNRLERMKQEVRRLRALSPNDRVALLAFAGRSYILSPLTVDDGALELFLDNLDPSVVGQAGSTLSRTISQGVELLASTPAAGDRALVIMSDGESFEEPQAILEAATAAAEANISVVTVGFGTAEGTSIPVRENGAVSLKRDENGQTVVTRYHPETLRGAAEAAGGTFVAAGETDKAAKIRAALSQLRTQRRAVDETRAMTPRFQLFLLPALLLLALDTLAVERRRPRRRLAPAAASTTALLLLSLLVPTPARADEVSDAARHFRARRYLQAVALYRTAITRGDDRPEVLYNLGTALLAADSLTAAIEVLERVARAPDAELRYRATFNLGLAHLRMGLAEDNQAADQSLRSALDAYKRVLLTRPTDLDAKWNYELALRKQRSGGGGGGGGADQSQGGQGGGGAGGEQERPSGELGQQQAQELLNSAAREERAVQGRKQRQTRPEPPRTGKDW
jgi:Ca-activated chloride channel family protein